MLKQITIENFAIFKNASIEPGEGFNVITGESGAGKSVVVNALSLICGSRAHKEIIRTGSDYALVEAVFEIPHKKKEIMEKFIGKTEDLLVITRQIFADKTSICKINGKIRNLSSIIYAASNIIDIHGQYENQSMLNSENHIKYLDSFSGKHLKTVLICYKEVLKEYKLNMNYIIRTSGSDLERERNKEIFEFQLNEINEADLLNLDETSLKERKKILENAEKYRSVAIEALNWLYINESNISDSVKESKKSLKFIMNNKEVEEIKEKLDDAYYLLEDVVVLLKEFSENIEFIPEEYENICETLENLEQLKRKYGSSIESILKFKDSIDKKLQDIKNFKQEFSVKLEKIKKLETTLSEYDNNISDIRKESAEKLTVLLLNELKEMGMKDCDMEIRITKCETKNSLGYINFSDNGRDICEFNISLNKGIKPMSMGKVASGGEMSRIMLAFKSVFSTKEATDTVVFDEIDSGISGEASIAVAAKLKKLSLQRQIICITHLPQIAARAQHHFMIKKEIVNGISQSYIEKLETMKRKIEVIASLTDGENISIEGLTHAEKILGKYN